MRALFMRFQFYANIAVVVSALLMAGCANTPPNRTDLHPVSDIARNPDFWQPGQLYLQAAPYPKLYVEVDAVHGCEPSEVTLAKLRAFLSTYCNKPEGIEIVRSDVIPIEDARGVSYEALAHKYLNGPPVATNVSSAFMYILFYDGKLCDEAVVAANGRMTKPQHLAERDLHPRMDFLPYPAAIYMNVNYKRRLLARYADLLLEHEAGHLLGLASRTNGASGHHCLDSGCLMNVTFRWHLGRKLLGREPVVQTNLCDDCKAELAERAKLAPGNLRFVGPVVVRSEAGYHVLSLPNRVKLIVGDLGEQECERFADGIRSEARLPDKETELRWEADADDEELKDTARFQQAINRAKADPYEVVRVAATALEKMVKAKPAKPN